MGSKLEWDGEKIRETITDEPKKHSPKDILNGLDNIRNQINQLQQQSVQLEQQTKQNANALRLNVETEKKLAEFEDKCIEIQKEKIKFIIDGISKECIEKAKKDADETIAKSPEAYDEKQVKQLPFLNYQKLLAINEKMADKIAGRMIRQFLYETPIFDNPF